jgi:hypothetical protein
VRPPPGTPTDRVAIAAYADAEEALRLARRAQRIATAALVLSLIGVVLATLVLIFGGSA